MFAGLLDKIRQLVAAIPRGDKLPALGQRPGPCRLLDLQTPST
jgi:hypothetical protein